MKKSVLMLALAGLLVSPTAVLAMDESKGANDVVLEIFVEENDQKIGTPTTPVTESPEYSNAEKLGEGWSGVEVTGVNDRTGRVSVEFNNSGEKSGWVADQANTPVEHAFTNEDVKYQNLFVSSDKASQYASRYANGRSVEILPVFINGQEYFYVVFGETTAPVAKEETKASEAKKAEGAKEVKVAATKTGSKALPKTSAAK